MCVRMGLVILKYHQVWTTLLAEFNLAPQQLFLAVALSVLLLSNASWFFRLVPVV